MSVGNPTQATTPRPGSCSGRVAGPGRVRVSRTGRRDAAPPAGSGGSREGSAGIVHVELDGVRRVLETDHLLHLELDVGVDLIVREDPALLQEFAIRI